MSLHTKETISARDNVKVVSVLAAVTLGTGLLGWRRQIDEPLARWSVFLVCLVKPAGVRVALGEKPLWPARLAYPPPLAPLPPRSGPKKTAMELSRGSSNSRQGRSARYSAELCGLAGRQTSGVLPSRMADTQVAPCNNHISTGNWWYDND